MFITWITAHLLLGVALRILAATMSWESLLESKGSIKTLLKLCGATPSDNWTSSS